MKKNIIFLIFVALLASCNKSPEVCPDGSNSPTCENYHLNNDSVEGL